MEIETVPKGFSVSEIELIYTPKLKISCLPKVNSSLEVYNLLLISWDKTKLQFVEQFRLMLLNRANRVLGICTLSTGGVTNTVIDMRLIFGAALKANACQIILAHNHPSGNLIPSISDEAITSQVKAAGKILEVKLIDHIIVTAEGYYSFADEGAI